MGASTTKTESSLTCLTEYTRYVWAYNTCGYSSAAILNQSTIGAIVPSPTAGTHVPGMSMIQWNWNPVPGATSYKWGTINSIASAQITTTQPSYTEQSLSCGTNYTRYVWAMGCGTSNPTILSQLTLPCSVCPSSITDTRDGQIYSTGLIGAQCWMKQNLNIGTRVCPQPLPYVCLGPQNPWNGIIEKYCYNNDNSNCAEYGGLYIFEEMMNQQPPGGQGICPEGWHVPMKAQWDTLIAFSGGTFVAGQNLKEAGATHWCTTNTGNNTSGFSALGAGFVSLFSYLDLNHNTSFWTSNPGNNFIDKAWKIWMTCETSGTLVHEWPKGDALSVRCIKD